MASKEPSTSLRSRSRSGGLGKANVAGRTLRAKIGGRVAALALPAPEAQRLERCVAAAPELRRQQAPPREALRLEHAYGFGSGTSFGFLAGTGGPDSKNFCYNVAGVGVIWDEELKEQRFQTHSSQITAMAFSSSARLVATGQKVVGTTAPVLLWSVDERPLGEGVQLMGHTHTLHSLAFSADGRWLFSLESSRGSRELKTASSPLHAWRLDDVLKGGRQARPAVSLPVKETFHIVTHPSNSNRLMGYGVRSVYFVTCRWAAKDAATAEWQSPAPPSDCAGLSFYGFSAGSFVGTDDLAAVAVNWGVFVINASADGPFCIRALALDNPEVHFLVPLCSGQVVCGGSGALLSLLGPDMASARPVKIMGVDADLLAAAALGEGVLMAGTRTGALCRIQLDEDELCDQCSGELLEQSPSGRAKVQALAANPSSQSPQLAVAAGGEVLIYDLAACCLQASTAVPSRGTVTAMAWHPKGFLALGVDLGALYCLPVAGDQLSELQPAEVLSDATEVTALQFAPQGQWLAVGFRDGRVQIMAVSHSDGTGAKLSHFRQLVGNASAVLGLQFAKDGSALGSNARDGAVLCWEVETGKVTPCNFPGEVWFEHPFRLSISWPMWGIWNKDSYRASTALCAESNGSKLGVGDEDGLVRLHRFPVGVPDAQGKEYFGHVSRIADLTWAGPDLLVTAGAASCAMLQWRVVAGQRRVEAEAADGDVEGCPPVLPTASLGESARTPRSLRNSAKSGSDKNSRASTGTARGTSPSARGGATPGSSRFASSGRQGSGSPMRQRSKSRSRGFNNSLGLAGDASSAPSPVPSPEAPKEPEKPRAQFSDAAVQTDSVLAARVAWVAVAPAPATSYAGRFVAVSPDREGSNFPAVVGQLPTNTRWQVCSRHTSPVRVLSPQRLTSAPAILPPGDGPYIPSSPATVSRVMPSFAAHQPALAPSVLRFVPTRSSSPLASPRVTIGPGSCFSYTPSEGQPGGSPRA